MAGDQRLSLSSGLWRNIDGTALRSARSTVTLVSAPLPALPVAVALAVVSDALKCPVALHQLDAAARGTWCLDVLQYYTSRTIGLSERSPIFVNHLLSSSLRR